MSAALFERASREGTVFNTTKGALTDRELWTMNLTSSVGHLSLDSIVVDLHEQLQGTKKTSFVNKTTAANEALQFKFDLAKYILDTRIAERDARATKAANDAVVAEQRRILRESIAAGENAALTTGTLEEQKARLAALGG